MLFTPWKLRQTEIKNRICVPAMVCYGFSDESGYVSDKNVEHYHKIAKGGAGLLIQEATCIAKEGRLSENQLGIWEDGQIEGLKRIVDAVHQENCPILVQIHHAGGVAVGDTLLAPSDYTCMKKGILKEAKAMSATQIEMVKQHFIDAGIRAYQAGYDGVELHGCHSFLLSQFLNRRVNRREDAYGTHPEQLIISIMDAIRKRTDENFIIGIRLGAFEPTLADGIKHAKQLEAAGIDFIDVSYGFSLEHEPYVEAEYPFNDLIYAAHQIRKNVSVPVFAVQKITSGEQAEAILKHTKVAMCDIGRGTLVNYNWANDVKANRDPGTCLYCKECMWRKDPGLCVGRKLLNRNREQ